MTLGRREVGDRRAGPLHEGESGSVAPFCLHDAPAVLARVLLVDEVQREDRLDGGALDLVVGSASSGAMAGAASR